MRGSTRHPLGRQSTNSRPRAARHAAISERAASDIRSDMPVSFSARIELAAT